MKYKVAINKANILLKEYNYMQLPIDVEGLAQKRGLTVMPYPLDDNISGVLVIKNGLGTIGYNQNESLVRRRFTIAHELGHFELHRAQSSLFMDKEFRVYFRSSKSVENPAVQYMEYEANAFAAALLMPEELLLKEVSKREFEIGNESALNDLANLFKVSSMALTYRLADFGWR